MILRWVSQSLGWCISWVRINRIDHVTLKQRDWVRKRRTPLSGWLIVLGNAVFRLRAVPVQVLHRQQWKRWEQTVQLAIGRSGQDRHRNALLSVADLHNVQSTTDESNAWFEPAGVYSVWIPGRTLREVLCDRSTSREQVSLTLAAALSRLYALHQIEIEIQTQTGRRRMKLSHGDASVANIMYDADRELMTWFDFDLRHDFNCVASDRHADDLRAFLFTAVDCLPSANGHDSCDARDIGLIAMLSAISDHYPDIVVWRTLARWLRGRSIARDPFHQAQRFRLRQTHRRRDCDSIVLTIANTASRGNPPGIGDP
jgi:hypothetical protein